jgi:hypothetical protein
VDADARLVTMEPCTRVNKGKTNEEEGRISRDILTNLMVKLREGRRFFPTIPLLRRSVSGVIYALRVGR